MNNKLKICSKCGIEKPHEDFPKHKYNKDGLYASCKSCTNARQKQIREAKKNGTYVLGRKPRLTPEERELRKLEQREYMKRYRKENADKIREYKKQVAEDAKLEGISHYGGKCACCGETEVGFLTIEHIHGRDSSIKRFTGKKEWLRLKRLGFPEGYTILCYNCNCAKGALGSCPHTWEGYDND